MDATIVFENIIQEIQNSCLNFKLEMSPFSASISLKKTFIRNKTGTLIRPSTLGSCPKNEINLTNAEMKELEAELHLLKSNNATLKMNYEEEAFESEAAKSRLNEALTRLDNLQTNFDQNVTCIENLKHAKNQIEMKHVKTCNEVKKYKDDVEDLKTELSQASVMIKTLKKESKEADIKHHKTLKKNDDTIDDLKRYKTVKQS